MPLETWLFCFLVVLAVAQSSPIGDFADDEQNSSIPDVEQSMELESLTPGDSDFEDVGQNSRISNVEQNLVDSADYDIENILVRQHIGPPTRFEAALMALEDGAPLSPLESMSSIPDDSSSEDVEQHSPISNVEQILVDSTDDEQNCSIQDDLPSEYLSPLATPPILSPLSPDVRQSESPARKSKGKGKRKWLIRKGKGNKGPGKRPASSSSSCESPSQELGHSLDRLSSSD